MYRASLVRLAVVMALGVVVTSAGWVVAQESAQRPRRSDRRVVSAATTWTTVSGCLEKGNEPLSEQEQSTGCQGIVLEARDGAVLLSHRRAMLNCCSDNRVIVERDGLTIRFREREEGELCYCLCPFDLEAGISELPDGIYLVQVLDPTGELLCERRVQLGPGSLAVAASGCLGDEEIPPASRATGDEVDDVDITVRDSSIVIDHLTEAQCCLELEVDLQETPGIYRVTEIDRGDTCRCLCSFALQIVIDQVPAGEHLVELVGLDGSVVATAVVTVGE